jgi:tRNA pseudouridine55 synthase
MSDPRPRTPRRKLDGILLLDKPHGISSNQALQQAKRLFRAEKAGHTGNLDPLATGLLPICFGEATKLSGLLLDADKRYIATARFGAKTTTGDAEGTVVAHSDPEALDLDLLAQSIERFKGPLRQTPPMYSALKRDGKPLYELARQGVEVERAPRDVVIHDLVLLSRDGHDLVLDVRCSKGTYIRTLVEDLAAAVGQCAHLSGLRRTEAGPFHGLPMWTIEALEARPPAERDEALLPMAAAIRDWPSVRLGPDLLRAFQRGRAVACGPLPRDVSIAVLDPAGRLYAVGQADASGQLAPRRWLGGESDAGATSYPQGAP